MNLKCSQIRILQCQFYFDMEKRVWQLVRLINSAVYTMQMLQTQVMGEAAEAGLTSDETVIDLVKEVRTKKA